MAASTAASAGCKLRVINSSASYYMCAAGRLASMWYPGASQAPKISGWQKSLRFAVNDARAVEMLCETDTVIASRHLNRRSDIDGPWYCRTSGLLNVGYQWTVTAFSSRGHLVGSMGSSWEEALNAPARQI